ncbi:unnamed protein product [Pedinophyceae sp. YPF-701]|nr:unnamed protein product [Pedinophyceae sp. YPF-701]
MKAPARRKGEYERLGILEGKDYGKTRIKYPDFTLTDSGLQYKDYKLGEGEVPRDGDRLTVDWSGVTLGYYGRPFEARNKPQGSSFAGDDKKYLMFTLGKDQVIPGVEEALRGMKPGGIRRIVVPAELGYPNGDFKNWKPTPSTFAGTRALDFVVKPNPGAMIDKTLLFDLQLVRVTPGEGR